MKPTGLVLAAVLLLVAVPAAADPPDSGAAEPGVVQRLQQDVSAAWVAGRAEAYLPLHARHMRFAYDERRLQGYNENPLGLGLGRGITAADGRWHGIYAMAFLDSHSSAQPVVGYAMQRPVAALGPVTARLGYTIFVTARADIGRYMPLPGILPLASLDYRGASLMAAYVPGGHNDGNVLFVFGKFALPR